MFAHLYSYITDGDDDDINCILLEILHWLPLKKKI